MQSPEEMGRDRQDGDGQVAKQRFWKKKEEENKQYRVDGEVEKCLGGSDNA